MSRMIDIGNVEKDTENKYKFFKDLNDRYFTIGRVYEDGKIVAYKIYSYNQKKVIGLVSKVTVIREMSEAQKAGKTLTIVGLKLNSNSRYVYVSELHYNSINMNKVDKVNGKGAPVEKLDNYFIVSYSGFGENRKYRLINSRGYEKIVTHEDFVKLVDEGKVNGACRSKMNANKITIFRDCDYREIIISENVEI